MSIMDMTPDTMLTVKEAAPLFGMSERRLRDYLSKGKIKGEKVGPRAQQSWFISGDEVAAFAAKNSFSPRSGCGNCESASLTKQLRHDFERSTAAHQYELLSLKQEMQHGRSSGNLLSETSEIVGSSMDEVHRLREEMSNVLMNIQIIQSEIEELKNELNQTFIVEERASEQPIAGPNSWFQTFLKGKPA